MINSSQLRNLISITVSFVDHCPEVEYEETVILDGANIRNESGSDYLIQSFSAYLLNTFEKITPAFPQPINQDDVIAWVKIFTEFVEEDLSIFVNRRSPLSLNQDHMDDTEYLTMIVSEFGKQVLSFVNDNAIPLNYAANDEPEKPVGANQDLTDFSRDFNFTTMVNSVAASIKRTPYSDISDRDVANLAFNSSREERKPYIAELYLRGLTRPGISKEATFGMITCAEAFVDGFDAVMPLYNERAQETFSIFADNDDLLLEFTITTLPITGASKHEATVSFSAGVPINGGMTQSSRLEFATDADHYVTSLQHAQTISRFLEDGHAKHELNDRHSTIAIGSVFVAVSIDPDSINLSLISDGESVVDYEFKNNLSKRVPVVAVDSDEDYDNVIYLR